MKRVVLNAASAVRRLLPARRSPVARPGDRLELVGPFADWASAVQVSRGYDDPAILERVLTASRAVRDGHAVYERDSFLFDTIQYAWPMLSGLLWVAAREGGRLRVMDIGGSLGSSWFQNRRYLSRLSDVAWGVVEQPSFVAVGQREFEVGPLRFFDRIDACVAAVQPDVVLLSGSLPFFEHPWAMLDEIVASPARYLLIDRTPFSSRDDDDIMVEHVPPEIYPASYACRIFSESKFRAWAEPHFEVIETFDALDAIPTPLPARWQGLLLARRDR
jgi:putative methyltransferase (TIGR04325 family)